MASSPGMTGVFRRVKPGSERQLLDDASNIGGSKAGGQQVAMAIN
jgi:hypothetical protein